MTASHSKSNFKLTIIKRMKIFLHFEFEAVANHAKWGKEKKTLQLRTLLTGEAKEVAHKTRETYVEL